MTTTRTGRWGRGRVGAGMSLFWRIFLVMLASVASVQLLNFIVVVFVTPPTPPIYSTMQVAAALRGQPDGAGEIVVQPESDTPPPRDPRADRMERAIAGLLGMTTDRVVVQFGGPPPQWMMASPVMNSLHPHRMGPPDARTHLLIGNFAVWVERPATGWVTARARRSGLAMWRWRALLWLLVAMVAVAPFAWALASRLTKPISLFAAAAERLGRDPRAAPVPIDGPAEIADAASAFNQMQARLNRYVEDRTTMIAAIAHDLRTPLMRLSLRLEQAPDALRASSLADIRDMQAMIGAGLAFFRDATATVERRRLDLRSLVESVTDDLADRGEQVMLHDGDPLVIDGDAAGLKSIVANLVGNALKYAGDAEVALTREDRNAVIAVRDHGAGVAPEDIDRVFDPFFRGERSRNRDTGGIGLGLASVRGVARAHGGDATIANHPDGGAIVRVTLPM